MHDSGVRLADNIAAVSGSVEEDPELSICRRSHSLDRSNGFALS